MSRADQDLVQDLAVRELPLVKSTQLNASSHSVILPSRTSKVPAHPERCLPLALAEHVGPVGEHDVAARGRVVDGDVDGDTALLGVEQHAADLRPLIVGSPVLRQTTSSSSSATAAFVSGSANSRKNSRTVCSGSVVAAMAR